MRRAKLWRLVGGFVVLVAVAAASGAGGVAVAVASSPLVSAPGVNWPEFRGGPWHSGTNPFETTLSASNVSGLGVKWMTNGPGWVSSPVVAGGVVYVGGALDQTLWALDEHTGTVKWRAQTGSWVDSTPAVAKGLVFVGCGDGYLYAFRTRDGSLAWKVPLGGSVESSPVVVGGVVYVGSEGGSVSALSASSGALIWQTYLDGGVDASPAVAGGSVFVGGLFTFYALDAATGAVRWTYVPGGVFFGSAAVKGGVVYAGSTYGYVFALNASSGALIWKRGADGSDGKVLSSPAVSGGRLYYTIVNFDWTHEKLQARRLSDGHLLWSHTYVPLGGGEIEPSPSVANGVVYAGSLDNSFRALDAKTGAVLWTYTDPAGGAFFASAAIADGQVFTAAASGNVYNFALPG
jgi:outer membrane protein assembly factor BamB